MARRVDATRGEIRALNPVVCPNRLIGVGVFHGGKYTNLNSLCLLFTHVALLCKPRSSGCMGFIFNDVDVASVTHRDIRNPSISTHNKAIKMRRTYSERPQKRQRLDSQEP